MSSILENAAKSSMAYYAGIKFISNIHLTKPKEIRRTFHERFLTWPWRPWRIFKTIQIPDPDYYLMNYQGNKVLVGHPDTINSIIEDLNRYLESRQ